MPLRKRKPKRRPSMLKAVRGFFKRGPRIKRVDLSKRFSRGPEIGQGSMSKVWRSRDAVNGRMVAVKVLDPVKTKRFESRFVGMNKPTEGEVAVSLDHPNIVRTFEHGLTLEGNQYLIMEFVEGVSLAYLVESQNETLRKNRMRFICELGAAVEYFHRANWIHRDLCPRNVLMDQHANSRPKLIDFGLAVPNTELFRRPGNRTGTAAYMAPELVKRLRTDQRIDIFSYAICCYEVFAGRHPWDTASVTLEAAVQHINQPPAEIREVVPDINDEVAEAIMRGLERNPDRRWPSITEMLQPLRAARRRIEPRDPDMDWSDDDPTSATNNAWQRFS